MTVLVHDIAQRGFGQGTNELYDRARPSYPMAALNAVRSAMASSPPFNVLEVGCGTGIFTRALLTHPAWSSAVGELRAVEPSDGMRAQFSEKVKDPRVSLREGTFENTHVSDGWADLVIVAQAFHWCPDYDKAMAEFNRALSPNGRAVFIWNLEDAATAWVRQIRQVVEAFEQGTPQYRLGLWQKTFQTHSYLKHFELPEEMTFNHTVTGSLQGVIDRALSKSYIAITSDETKAQISKGVREIIERGDEKVWIDEQQGTFEYPYTNTVIVMKKK